MFSQQAEYIIEESQKQGWEDSLLERARLDSNERRVETEEKRERTKKKGKE